MLIPKHKPLRLKGQRLHQLYTKVYNRDNGLCGCGKWVEPGTPPHHIIPRSQGGEDIEDNLITICFDCHDQIHHRQGCPAWE